MAGLLDTERDPRYLYGSLLPVRAMIDPATGKAVPGSQEWGLGYSDAIRGLLDTFAMPGRALRGEQITPEQAMGFAMNVTAPGVATARYAPGVVNMPTVYHGSPKMFTEFDATKASGKKGRSQYGIGTYVTESKDIASQYSGPRGKVYEADLPDEMASRMLDFGKDITEQPKNVQAAIQEISKKYGMSQYSGDLRFKRAGNFMMDLSAALGQKQGKSGPTLSKEASEIMRQYGVPGIKYMTDIAVSSAGKKSVPSYVLFPGEEKKAKIRTNPS